jgi:vacuolar-type H+-ATPase subunit I/STV1
MVALFSLTAVAMPLSLAGQAPPQLPDSVQRMVRQLEVLETRLGPIEQMALATAPELTEMSSQIQGDVVVRMLEMYPSLSDGMDRLMFMEEEKVAAQQAANVGRIEQLMAQGSALNDSIQAARDEALQDEALRTRLREYQEALVVQMIAIDPNAELIIDEMTALNARIEAADLGGDE